MKKFNKIMSLLLALVMLLSLVACGGKTDSTEPNGTVAEGTVANTPAVWVDPYADLADDYDTLSQAIYDEVLGDYYTVYSAAKEATNVSERQALMAVAEAKLLESGIMLPLTTAGGNYAISRVAPYTSTSTLWGNDSDRYHNVLVATEPLTVEHRDEMKAKWAELKGTGTWEEWAKNYLIEKGYTLKDSYSFGYTSDPQTWDVLATSMAADSEAIVNTYDGLVEYNSENQLVAALAESWTANDDETVFTFKLREGVKWVDSQGREVAEVTADDFVAGMQHMMDAMGGLEYLVGAEGCNIVNADAYINGEVTDFTQVGVKAVDTYTVEYTLEAPCSFFMTMLGYGVFAPMNRSYYESQGGKFGADYDSAAESYTYGKTADNIAYCGPYLVSNATALNTIVFKANPSYWNAENINVKTITWLYNDGSDPTKAYNDTMSGVLDGAGLNTNAVEAAKTDGVFDTLCYVAATNATSYMGFVNLRRATLANFNDGTTATSLKTEEQVERFNGAILNQHFRLALAFSVDRASYNAQSVGEALKLNRLRNSYVPGTFITLEEEVTIDINGTATTFAAGTNYGAILQAQLDADGMPVTVWDPTAEGGIGSSDGFDGWYNPEAAAAELAIAIEELAAQGLEISAENPIYVDLPYYSASQSSSNMSNVYKQSVEAVLGGAVIVNLVDCVDQMSYYYATYFNPTGAEGNYDINTNTGWGPDYGDPQTYLDTMLPAYSGYMTKAIGIF